MWSQQSETYRAKAAKNKRSKEPHLLALLREAFSKIMLDHYEALNRFKATICFLTASSS